MEEHLVENQEGGLGTSEPAIPANDGVVEERRWVGNFVEQLAGG